MTEEDEWQCRRWRKEEEEGEEEEPSSILPLRKEGRGCQTLHDVSLPQDLDEKECHVSGVSARCFLRGVP